MKILFSSFCLVLIFLVNSSFGCTLAGKSLFDFDPTEYIFIGEVVGFTQPVESAKLHGKAHGVIVKMKESVYLPEIPKTHFEVFPIQLRADCSEDGTPLEDLKKKFTIGSEVRVIAKEAEILPKNLPDGNIRLEDRPAELGSIEINIDEKGKRMTSVDSVFDYKSFKYDMDEDSDSKYLLPNFEIRKDLLRLKKSKTQKERTEILERLLDAPICCNDLDFHLVFKTYSSSEAEFNLLDEIRLRKVLSKEEFKQYKAIKDTRSELIKLGYDGDVADKVMEKAIQEGTDLTKAKLLERSLQILRNK
jgi:hypothetical protein